MFNFKIKQLAEKFRSQFECLGENTKKYFTSSVPIKKHDNGKATTYKLKVIDNYRFMPSSLSNLVDNLSEINDKECDSCKERKGIKSKYDFIGFKNNRLNYICKDVEKDALSQ